MYIWLFIVLLPFMFGPFLLKLMDIAKLLPESTGGFTRRKQMVTFLSILVTTTYSTKLILVEKIAQSFLSLNQMNSLLCKYLVGSLDIVLAPLLILMLDKDLFKVMTDIYKKRTNTQKDWQ